MNQFELVETEACDAPVVGVFNLLLLAVGGAKNANGLGAMSLDFEMERTGGFHDGYE